MTTNNEDRPIATMDPAEFADLLRASFGGEPPHGSADDDLARGRRRLRRSRLVRSAAIAAAAVVVVGATARISTVGDGPDPTVAPASLGTDLSDEQVLDACLSAVRLGGETLKNSDELSEAELVRGLRALMSEPELMTVARSDREVLATLRAGDGQSWEDCHLEVSASGAVDGYGSVYPTGVTFPFDVVGGVRVYEPVNEADSRLLGTATGPGLQYWVPCEVTAPEETEQWREELASCDTFTVTWNDRRVPDVARAKIITPDGIATWADVQDGYLSFSHTGDMAPEVAESLRTSTSVQGDRVILYDDAGNVLVDEDGTGGPETLSIANYPSLAYWLK